MNVTTQNDNQSYQRMHAIPATILLVEDEAAVRDVTREALEMGGYHVLTADGAAAATHIVCDESTAIDLLLTDVIMPEHEWPGVGAAGEGDTAGTEYDVHDRICGE